MTGILLLFVAVLWVAIAIGLSMFIARKIPSTLWGSLIGVLVFVLILPLPLVDEIVGKRQFEKLCEGRADVIVDAKNTQGRTVWFGESERTKVQLSTLQITQAKRNFVDAKTQEPLYHYYRFEASGGWLIHFLGISEGGTPLLFDGVCQPKSLETIDAQLGLTHINRPN